MALDADLESPTFNAYVTVAEATAILAERLHVDPWYQAGTTTEGYGSLAHRREASLIWATLLINTHITWAVPPDTWEEIPYDVQRATAYYALALLGEPAPTAGSSSTGAQVKRKRIGALDIEYHIPADQAAVVLPSQGLPEEIQALLAAYGTVPDPAVKYVSIEVF